MYRTPSDVRAHRRWCGVRRLSLPRIRAGSLVVRLQSPPDGHVDAPQKGESGRRERAVRARRGNGPLPVSYSDAISQRTKQEPGEAGTHWRPLLLSRAGRAGTATSDVTRTSTRQPRASATSAIEASVRFRPPLRSCEMWPLVLFIRSASWLWMRPALSIAATNACVTSRISCSRRSFRRSSRSASASSCSDGGIRPPTRG